MLQSINVVMAEVFVFLRTTNMFCSFVFKSEKGTRVPVKLEKGIFKDRTLCNSSFVKLINFRDGSNTEIEMNS